MDIENTSRCVYVCGVCVCVCVRVVCVCACVCVCVCVHSHVQNGNTLSNVIIT